MARRAEIIAALDEVLATSEFRDSCPNGLQVPGSSTVEKIVTGVSAGARLFELAAEENAQMVLVHHGLFWDGRSRSVTPQLKRRLEALFQADMNLAAYHLPLDGNRKLGNNVLLCSQLGFEIDPSPFASYGGRPIGAIGRRRDGISLSDLITAIGRTLGGRTTVFGGGPERIKTIGVVSGGGARSLDEAVSLGLDAFMTGEAAEHSQADALEQGVHFIAAGHYSTETVGIRALGDWIADRFGIEHVFIDVPNPV